MVKQRAALLGSRGLEVTENAVQVMRGVGQVLSGRSTKGRAVEADVPAIIRSGVVRAPTSLFPCLKGPLVQVVADLVHAIRPVPPDFSGGRERLSAEAASRPSITAIRSGRVVSTPLEVHAVASGEAVVGDVRRLHGNGTSDHFLRRAVSRPALPDVEVTKVYGAPLSVVLSALEIAGSVQTSLSSGLAQATVTGLAPLSHKGP